MMTFIATLHIIVAIVLIALVLIQDTKGGGALGIGGGGSNSVLGATGAQTLASKATAISAIIFAITCIGLSVLTAQKTKSVLDSVPVTSIPATETAPAANAAAPQDSTVPATQDTSSSAAQKTQEQPSAPAGK